MPGWRHAGTLIALLGLALAAAAFTLVPDRHAAAGTLVVADLRGHALIFVDLAEPGNADRVELPGGPHELVALQDGRIVASLEQGGTLAVVAIDGTTELHEIGGLPHGLALQRGATPGEPDTLLVTDREAGSVRRFRLDTWRELVPLASGTTPHAVAMFGEAAAVANADAGASSLQLIAGTSDGALRVPAPSISESLAVSPTQDTIAIAGASDGVIALFNGLGDRLGEVEVGARPVRLAFDATGEHLAVALSADGSIALLDGLRVRWRVTIGGLPDGLAFDSQGHWLFAGDLASGVVTALEVDTGRVVARFDVGQSAGALLSLP